MEVDDVGMRAGDDETSTGWCFAVTSLSAVVGSTGYLLLDSGSDEHLCTPTFAALIPTSRDRSPLKLKDVQQNDLVISGQKTVPMLVGPTVGKHAMEARPHSELPRCVTTSCRWEGFSFNLGPGGCSMEKDGRKVPLYLERNSLRLEAHVLQRASRPGYVAAGTAVTDERDERMDGMDVNESHSSSSAGPVVEAPAVEPAAEAGTTPAPVLKTWSSIKELHSRLRELGALIYGTKDVLCRRLCEYVQIAARKKKSNICNRGGRSWRWQQNR